MYKALSRLIILYGSEYWTLNKSVEKKLLIFERTILRKTSEAVNEKAHGDHVIIIKCIKSTTNMILWKLLKVPQLDGLDIYAH